MLTNLARGRASGHRIWPAGVQLGDRGVPNVSGLLTLLSLTCAAPAPILLAEFRDPPREFSLTPFWFWNDTLEPDRIRAQIADF